MRKDAARNRDLLIEAASATMRAEGGDVAMELIAERAGVTRGTVYRNFPHRQAMYEAVLERDLTRLESQIAFDTPNDPLAFIHHMAQLMTVYDHFLVLLADMADYDAAANEARMVAVLAPYLSAAQKIGRLRATLTGPDILVACRMLASHWKLDAKADFATTFDRRLALLIAGLGAPGSVTEGLRA